MGAPAELTKAFKERNHQKIITSLCKIMAMSECPEKETWPSASNMGRVCETQIRSARKILGSLLKTNGASLSDESLQTLLVEAEAIVISRPLTTDLLSDVNSRIPLSPIHLLTMKSKGVMPPPGVFSTPNIYSRKHLGRVQHISK